MAKQGEVTSITQKNAPEFKGTGEEVKKGANSQEGVKRTSVITMMNGRPHKVYFEDGKQVKAEAI